MIILGGPSDCQELGAIRRPLLRLGEGSGMRWLYAFIYWAYERLRVVFPCPPHSCQGGVLFEICLDLGQWLVTSAVK